MTFIEKLKAWGDATDSNPHNLCNVIKDAAKELEKVTKERDELLTRLGVTLDARI